MTLQLHVLQPAQLTLNSNFNIPADADSTPHEVVSRSDRNQDGRCLYSSESS